tara:strand:+ start:442 stop:789 length:348 start_codon:yes stop_codon:yes gene_type:complete
MKKGFYWISTHSRDKEGKSFMLPQLQEGSYEYHGNLFVHRYIDHQDHPIKWKVSHVNSGSSVQGQMLLSEARNLAKALKDFPIFELGSHDELTAAIACPSNEDQVNEIKKIMRGY